MKKLLAVAYLTCGLAATVFGQAGIGAISGTVRDPSGSVVSGATVTVSNESKGIQRELTTNDAGLFAAPALVPADGYAVSVVKAGFARHQIPNITIQVGQTVNLSVALTLSTVATTVEVTAAAPVIEDTKSGVTDVISTLQIDNLPINGRRADTFALLTPGVVRDGTFGLVSFHGISAGNAFLTDGNLTTNAFYSENASRTRASSSISADAVQEFEVVSDGYSPEFGRAMGGIINTVTRSGSNDTHGTFYWFFRNRTLEAADRYANGFRPPEFRHQAGATLSGALKKDKIFYFMNFEVVKRNFPGLNKILTRQIADATGLTVDPTQCLTTGSTAASPAQCTAAINFIQAQMGILVPREISSVLGFSKLDFHPSDNNTVTLSGNVMHWRSPNGIQNGIVVSPTGALLGNNGNSTVETRFVTANWIRTLGSSAVNNMRLGWFKDRLSDPAISTLPSTGLVSLSVAGATVGAASAYPRTQPSEQRWELADNFSLIKGSHSMKFGFDFTTTQDWINQIFNGNGSYSYANLTAFARDFSGAGFGKSYTSFSQAFGNPIQDLRTNEIDLYAMDNWKVGRKLTLNYGVRYEKTFLPQPTVSDPNYPQTGRIPGTSRNIAPRISAAWSLDNKTVVRAGYGIFWAPFIINGLDQLFLGNGKYQTTVSINPTTQAPIAPVFPNIYASSAGLPGGTVNLTFAADDFHNPYSQQATLALQRDLGHGMDITPSYIYTRGIGLITSPDVNLSAPGITRTYQILDTAGTTVSNFTTPIWTTANKIDSRYAHLYLATNGGDSWYNALAIQFRKRFAHGFTAQVAYTWSHAIDDAQQSGGSSAITYGQSSTYNGNNALDKGSSGIDQRHRASINWLWNPTFTKSTSAFARYFVNGWELSSITTLASSQPVSAFLSVSGAQFTGVTMAYTSFNGSGGWGRAPFLPVNSQDVDRQYTVDARLSRNIPVTERIRLALKFEAFNAFNTQYNTGIATTAYTVANGIAKPQVGFGLGNASGAFPDGTNARKAQVSMRVTF